MEEKKLQTVTFKNEIEFLQEIHDEYREIRINSITVNEDKSITMEYTVEKDI